MAVGPTLDYYRQLAEWEKGGKQGPKPEPPKTGGLDGFTEAITAPGDAVRGVVNNVVDGYTGVSTDQSEEDRLRNLDLQKRALELEGRALTMGDPGTVDYNLSPDAHTIPGMTIQGTRDIEAPNMAPVERVSSRDVTAPDMGSAREVAFHQPGPVERAAALSVKGARIDTGASDQVRTQQMGLAQDLRDAAAGKAPSVAENQFKGALSDIANEVAGKAATAKGSDRAYARLTAQKQIADMGRRAAFDAGQLRAGETATARGQLGGLLTDTRGADTSLATDQARLTQAADTTNAELGTRVAEGNRDAANRSEEVAAQLRLEADKANQDAANKRTELTAGMRMEADTGNANRGLAADTTNADAANAREVEKSRQQIEVAEGNRDATLDVQKTNAGLITDAEKFAADAKNRREELIAGGKFEAGSANRDSQQQRDEFKQTAATSALGTALGASNAASNNTATTMDTQAKNKAGKREGIRDLAAGGQALLPKSDIRSKEDIREVAPEAAERLAKQVDIISFKYKDDPRKAEHVGVSAQQLEKDPLGKKFVSKDDEGMRHVNYSEMVPALLLAALKAKKEAGAR